MEVNMPIIHVELVEGRTKEQKKQLGEAITKAGYNTETAVIVTNVDRYQVTLIADGEVSHGDDLLNIESKSE